MHSTRKTLPVPPESCGFLPVYRCRHETTYAFFLCIANFFLKKNQLRMIIKVLKRKKRLSHYGINIWFVSNIK